MQEEAAEMTIQESTICSLVQTFPILLIMAQNHNRCLKTPLLYKPPTPTQPPEYYEALDALFHNLFGHGYPGDHGHGSQGGQGCYGHGTYVYDKKFGHTGHSTPCYTHSYPTTGFGHSPGLESSGHGYGVSAYPGTYYGTSSYPTYGYKKVKIYNVSGGIPNYAKGTLPTQGTYAPAQTYNMNHKYKVVVKKNKVRSGKRRPQKLQGFNREYRRFLNAPFGFPQNFIPQHSHNGRHDFGFGFNVNRPSNPHRYYYDRYGRPIVYPPNMYRDPSYQDQNYQNPNYQDPNYQNPNYQDPNYQNPNYQDPNYQNPKYQDPNYQNPNYQSFPNPDVPAWGNRYSEEDETQSPNVHFPTEGNKFNQADVPFKQPEIPLVPAKESQDREEGKSVKFPEDPPGVPLVPPERPSEDTDAKPGIPVVPPVGPSDEDKPGIPIDPPVTPAGIPTGPPPALEIPTGLPELKPVGTLPNEAFTLATGLPELTPFPTTGPPELKPAGALPPEPAFTSAPTATETTPKSYDLPTLTPVPQSSRNSFNADGFFSADSCQIEDVAGNCVNIVQCPRYLQVLKSAQANPAAVAQLRKAHCGFDGNNPKVCCPKAGIPDQPPPQPTSTTTTSTTTAAPVASKTEVGPEDYIAAYPEPPVCGLSNASFSRVVGGIDAKLGDFPWMALLGYKQRAGTSWLCGGSLVSSKHVLTAAHCVHNKEASLYVVRLGELDLDRDDDGATPVDILIRKLLKHTGYSPTSLENDIALLVLEKEASFTDLIRPICLPRSREMRANTFETYNPLVAGWGRLAYRGAVPTKLQVVQLPVQNTDVCKEAYKAYKSNIIDQRNMCVGYKKGGKDTCQGDSGGPLMQPIWDPQVFTTYFYQIGVVSYGRACAEAGYPGIYTRVTEFVPWLDNLILGKKD